MRAHGLILHCAKIPLCIIDTCALEYAMSVHAMSKPKTFLCEAISFEKRVMRFVSSVHDLQSCIHVHDVCMIVYACMIDWTPHSGTRPAPVRSPGNGKRPTRIRFIGMVHPNMTPK